jgi:hypothetical protein
MSSNQRLDYAAFPEQRLNFEPSVAHPEGSVTVLARASGKARATYFIVRAQLGFSTSGLLKLLIVIPGTGCAI